MRLALIALIVFHAMTARAVERVKSMVVRWQRGVEMSARGVVAVTRAASGYTDGKRACSSEDVGRIAELVLVEPATAFDLDSLGYTQGRVEAFARETFLREPVPVAWVDLL